MNIFTNNFPFPLRNSVQFCHFCVNLHTAVRLKNEQITSLPSYLQTGLFVAYIPLCQGSVDGLLNLLFNKELSSMMLHHPDQGIPAGPALGNTAG